MNNFSPLPVSASDSRLSSPEAAAPNVNPALQARRRKLRRIVAWVVGGATLLICVGLVSAAIRSHSERASDVAASPAPQAVAALPTPTPSTPVTSALPAPDPTAMQAAALPAATQNVAPVVAPKLAKKPTVTHAAKPVAKAAKRAAVAKSAVARH